MAQEHSFESGNAISKAIHRVRKGRAFAVGQDARSNGKREVAHRSAIADDPAISEEGRLLELSDLCSRETPIPDVFGQQALSV